MFPRYEVRIIKENRQIGIIYNLKKEKRCFCYNT